MKPRDVEAFRKFQQEGWKLQSERLSQAYEKGKEQSEET